MTADSARRRLVGVVAATIAGTIFLFACASSSVPSLWSFSQQARWGALFALLALSLVLAGVSGAWRPPKAAYVATFVFVALAVISASWSVYPLLTTKRAGTLVILLAVAAALASASFRHPKTFDAFLLGLLGGATAVALAGIAVFFDNRAAALQPATDDMPARWEGFGVSANTVPTLLALALPIAAWFVFRGGRGLRLASAAAFALIVLSIFASGSRGGTIASFAGVAFVVLAVGTSGRKKAALLVCLVAFYGLGTALFDQRGVLDELNRTSQPPPPPDPGETVSGEGAPPSAGGFRVVQHNPYDVYTAGIARLAAPEPRGFFGAADGRLVVWRDAIAQGRSRPGTGFGFGTEEQIFVDRSSEFSGGRPENSFVGIFLQLGIVGLVAFLGAVAAYLLAFLRQPQNTAAAASAGVLVAGTVMCMFQSYVYSVGNIATTTFWIAALLTATGTSEKTITSGDANDVASAVAVPLPEGFAGNDRTEQANIRR